MSNVALSTELPVTADQVWSVIGNFNALAQWHPAVESSSLEEGGTVRRLTLAGDGGGDLASAMRFATVGAGLACTVLGAQTSLATRAEIEARLADLA